MSRIELTSKIAIVGAGPSECFMAQSLGKACPDVEITIIDKLPVPYGLVRHGVAPIIKVPKRSSDSLPDCLKNRE
jgi:ribulose 1,5-bisphosphate synthetase/thiazole synthase